LLKNAAHSRRLAESPDRKTAERARGFLPS
jgi:hypothetical protein